MLDLTKNLTKKVHQLPKDGETENFHSVPQIFSSLRLELVFWPDLLIYYGYLGCGIKSRAVLLNFRPL